MKNIFILSGLILSFNFCGFSQSNHLEKKLEKATELVNKNKINDADSYLENVLKDNPEYGDGWDLLAKIRYKEYKDSKMSDNILGGNLVVTTTDSKGKKIENDSLSNSLMDLLNNIKPSKKAFSKYTYTMRKALLTSENANYCSVMLRNFYIDEAVDTAVCKKALKYYDNAEDEFSKKNYDKAAKFYKRAIEEQPDFYKANMYLGDCYYFMKDYVEAGNYFKKSKERFPNQLEPRKYLVDAYSKQNLFPKALDESIEGMTVYPDLSLIEKVEDAAYLNNKKIDIKWTPRGVFPNKIKKEEPKSDLNEYTEKEPVTAKTPWTYYENALNKIKDNCDKNGIITKTNNLSPTKYLEVFSWEEMLNNSTDKSLEEARKMQKEGYLDCYVLITCFHIDIYDQYKDFVSKNKEKVMEYYRKHLVNM